jgi:hypothetical protein
VLAVARLAGAIPRMVGRGGCPAGWVLSAGAPMSAHMGAFNNPGGSFTLPDIGGVVAGFGGGCRCRLTGCGWRVE